MAIGPLVLEGSALLVLEESALLVLEESVTSGLAAPETMGPSLDYHYRAGQK